MASGPARSVEFSGRGDDLVVAAVRRWDVDWANGGITRDPNFDRAGNVLKSWGVGTFVFVLPKVADYRSVWAVVKELSWPQVVLLVGATALNLATYAPPWMAALPGLRFRQAFVVTQASTASTYVAPGGAAVGMALSFGMLRAWGFASTSVSLAVAVTGIWCCSA